MGTSAWGWSFFSKVWSSRSIKLYKPRNWLWQLETTMYGYISWHHSLCIVTRQISITSVWGQSAILPTYNKLCSHFQLAPQRTLTLQNWYTHTCTPQHSKKYAKIYCASSRWDISAEEIYQKMEVYCFVANLIFCFMYTLNFHVILL
jgi:hypothetical protein